MKGAPNPSLADCWRWLKGLLYDFISLKRQCKKLEKSNEKADKLIDSLTLRLERLHAYQVYYDTSKRNQESLRKVMPHGDKVRNSKS